MTPDTVHLAAQMIRHQRAMVTSVETWVRKQPPAPACREMLQLVVMYRDVLTKVETALSQFEVSEDVRT